MTQKPFEDFLKSKAEEFQPKPNPNNWDKIAAALPPETKKKRLTLWIPISIAACLSALMFGIFAFKNNNNIGVVEPLKINKKSESHSLSSNSNQKASEKNNSLKLKVTQKNSISNVSKTNNSVIDTRTAQSKDITLNPLTPSNKHQEIPAKKIDHDNLENTSLITQIAGKENQQEISSNLRLKDNILNIDFLNPDIDRYSSLKTIDRSLISYNVSEHQSKKDSSLITKIGTKPIQEKSHRLAINFTPLYVNTIISQPNNIGTNSTEYNDRKNEDKAKFSFNSGLTYLLKKNKHSYSIGIQYTQISYSMYLTSVSYSPSLSTINRLGNFNYAGDSFVTTPKDDAGGRVTNIYRYISIPITYSKYLFNNSNKFRNKFAIQFGASYNRTISQSGLLNQSNGVYVRPRSSEENNVTKQHVSLRTGIEFNQTLTHRTLFFISPFYQRSLSAIEKGSISTSYASWGLGFGLQIKLH